MATISEALTLAVQHQQAGRLQVAEQIYRQILAVEPQQPETLHLLGVLALQVGQPVAAAEYIGHAIALKGTEAAFHNNLGTAFKDQGKLDLAVACYHQALALKPDHAGALNNLGNALKEQGKLEEAVTCYRQALALKPDYTEAYNNLGLVFVEQRKWEDAVACYRRSLELRPDFAEAYYHLGNVFLEQGKRDDAAACYQRSLALKPDCAEAQNNLGKIFMEKWQLEDAVACYRRALELKWDFAEAHYNLGTAFMHQRKLEEAVACYRQALTLKPNFAEAHYNLGNAYKDLGKLDEAVACYRQTLKLKPDSAEALNNLGTAAKDQGQLDDAVVYYRRALSIRPDFAEAHSNLVYALIFSPDYDAQALYEAHRLWNQQQAEPLTKFIRPHSNERSPHRRLRIGYVSPNFRAHAESYFTVPLLAAHDHQNFEIFCYAEVPSPDSITARLRGYTDVWRDIRGLSDEQATDQIRADQIDILVDLTMHLAGNRLLVFARKPAPVQVCWLAYQGTTGLPAIDYRLTDPWIDPPGLEDRYYAEESLRLPDSFWCYDPLTSEPAVHSLPALNKGYVTFGSLNNFCKVNDSVLKLWARILRLIQQSRLVLLAPEGSHRLHVLDLLGQEAIAPERVTFVPFQSRPQYLAVYHDIDIGLDTFPYNGQTTTLDSFWLGVPVVTLRGRTAVARAGVSLLQNLGLPELIAETPEQFVSIATGLAGDLPRLSHLRATLRQRLQASPLMDAPRFARNVEAAYRGMWQRWCASSLARS